MLSILRHVKSCYNIFLEYRCMSTVSLPDLHIILNEKGEAKLDFLYPFRKRAAPVEETPNQCSLAGQPKMLPGSVLQFSEDILVKWDQKPERDIYKERVKRTFTY